MSITVTADVVAWYAAVVAAAALAVNAYSAWRDRAHLVVRARAGYRVTPGPHPYSPDTSYISITVANRGRRPTTVERVWITRKTMKEVALLHDSFVRGPRELKEGTSTDYMVDQSQIDLDDVKHIYAADQAGRKWRCRLER